MRMFNILLHAVIPALPMYLVSMVFGTAIPTFLWNVFILVSLFFHCTVV